MDDLRILQTRWDDAAARRTIHRLRQITAAQSRAAPAYAALLTIVLVGVVFEALAGLILRLPA